MNRLTRLAVPAALLALLAIPGLSGADDRGIVGLKLVLIDKYAASSRAKVTFVSKDPANVAVYALPGPWASNKPTVSKYVNPAAAPGGPGAKVVTVKPGNVLKVVAKNLGDGDETSGDDGPTDLDLNDPPGTCTLTVGNTLEVEVTLEDAATRGSPRKPRPRVSATLFLVDSRARAV